MPILQNQAKNMICQKVNLLCPSSGTPFQIVVSATGQNSENELIPNLGKTPTAAALKSIIMHGAAIFGNLEMTLRPNMATTVVIAPIPNTVIPQPILFGYTAVSEGISRLKGIPAAVAETAIIEPAKKQNSAAFTK